MRITRITLCMFLLLSAVCSIQANGVKLEKIEIAPDNWTFRGAETKELFVPFGVNYTPGEWAKNWRFWYPDYFAKDVWDEQKVRDDFKLMASFGVNITKVALPYDRMDVALWAYNHSRTAEDLAAAIGIDAEHAAYIYKDIENKRKTTHYMHAAAVLVEDVPEINK